MTIIHFVATHYIQGLSISSNDTSGLVLVKCIFIQGLPAKECHLVFTDAVQGVEEYFNISGSDYTSLSLSVSGNYTVSAYDLINGSIIGPAVKHFLSLIIAISSPSSTSVASTKIFSAVISELLISSSIVSSRFNEYSVILEMPSGKKVVQCSF